MESQELALLHERKALMDLSFQLTKTPRKTINPKCSSTASTGTETVIQRTNKEYKGPAVIKSTLRKDASEDNIPSETAATLKDGDSKPEASPETRSAATQKGDSKNSIPYDPKEGTQQSDDQCASSNIKMTPLIDASPTSATEVTLDDQKVSADQILHDNYDEFDFVSPEGMKRMFGSLSQESKIQFSPASPIYVPNESPTSL